MNRRINQKYKEKLLNSLKKDIDKWRRGGYRAAGCSWVEYRSPEYGRVLFICELGGNVGVYIDGRRRFSITPVMFSRLWWAIKHMKKEVDDTIEGKSNKFLERALDD